MKPNIAEYKKMLASATPGPWMYEETDDGHVIRMGEAIESPYLHDSHLVIEYDHGCYYADDEEENDAENSQANEAAANAELIAKAPETIESLIGEVERQAEEITAMQKVIKEQDELLDSANNAIEPLNDELEYERNENERLRKALEVIAISKTSLASTLKTMAGEALRRDTASEG